MRALTLTQPWAGLVASGIKLVENRPRMMIKNADVLKRPRIAIHASRVIDESVYYYIFERAPWLEPGYLDSLWYRLSRITSAILSTHTLTDALYIGGTRQDVIEESLARIGIAEQACFTFGPTVYVLADARQLATPVTCRGYQAFWTLAPELERAVVEQLA